MASVFGHSLAALALGKAFSKELRKPKLWILGILCSIAPDADVLGFKFGIAYKSFWGHRGFTHSFFFAILFGFLIAYLFYKSRRNIIALYFILCTASHSILDAMTTGGKGVAFLSPFENSRYFLPWRPIKVSPMSASKFFSEWGLEVIKSELLWIGVPFIILLAGIKLIKYITR
ncbi:metal-dependent hydrolase [Bacteroidia bacterium]|nr:metal-dependent hydrolase [Bacteroidia bacterium]MDB4106843.1 metal-dependent hydrolase [Bacteroidia bacterium]MDB9883210.1 metal-dependent hydrolase [Bacteroidia bacterium]